MPTAHEPLTGLPDVTGVATREDFAAKLRELRKWAGLTQKRLESADSARSDSTISAYERGVSLPGLEWLHTYVKQCLQHRLPGATDVQLEAMFAPWREALTRVRGGTNKTSEVPSPTPGEVIDSTHEFPGPTAEPTSGLTSRAEDLWGSAGRLRPALSLGPSDQNTAEPARAGQRRAVALLRRPRTWVLGSITVVIVAGAALVVGRIGGLEFFGSSSDTGASAPTATTVPASAVSSVAVSPGINPASTVAPAAAPTSTTGTAAAPPSVRPTGKASTPHQVAPAPVPVVPQAPSARVAWSANSLEDPEGIDLDTPTPDNNARRGQYEVGVDISFSSGASHLDAMAVRVSYTVLPDTGAVDYYRCVNATGWTRTYPSMYDLAEDRNICVKTDEARYAMLTITQRATSSSGTVSLKYTTWN